MCGLGLSYAALVKMRSCIVPRKIETSTLRGFLPPSARAGKYCLFQQRIFAQGDAATLFYIQNGRVRFTVVSPRQGSDPRAFM